ncbi:hypothetical protein ELG97_36840 (plasmid) [Rhizobium leguminosarum]|nr:hypothetical protein ELG97_36840 [Rhizobium leguminosarum]
MDIFLDGVRDEFGAEELHFTEIFSGKGVWERVSVDKRAEVIQLMASVMEATGLPVVHQSVAEFTTLDHPNWRLPTGVGDWDLEDLSQFGLLMLCSRASHHIRAMKQKGPSDFDLPFPLYVDAGILPHEGARKLPNWDDVIEGPTAQFRDSASLAGLQLADFAAFVINRSQWIAVTRTPGPLNKAERAILTAGAGLNIVNLPFRPVVAADFGRESHEEWLSADRVAKGLSPRPLKKAVDVCYLGPNGD